jgi:hypothetical protein
MCRQDIIAVLFSFPFRAPVCGCGRGGREISILLVYQCAGRPLVVVMFTHTCKVFQLLIVRMSRMLAAHMCFVNLGENLCFSAHCPLFLKLTKRTLCYMYMCCPLGYNIIHRREVHQNCRVFLKRVSIWHMIRHLNLAKLFATADESRETCSRLGIWKSSSELLDTSRPATSL